MGTLLQVSELFFSSHCLNLEWDQIRHRGLTNAVWRYCCGTAESWCLFIFLQRTWQHSLFWGGCLGVSSSPVFPRCANSVLNLKSFFLQSVCLACCATPLITCEEICLCVFFPLTVHTPSKYSCNISLHAASTIKKHDLVEKILTFLGSACPAAV